LRSTVLICLLCLGIFKVPGHKTATNTWTIINSHAFIDTSKYAVIKFYNEQPYMFDKNSHPTKLTDSDISQIEKLLDKKVAELNKKVKSKGVIKSDYIKNPSRFYKQFVAVINSKGEKEVWVNCFCSVENEPNWKTAIVGVLDGGSCYFNFKVNLTTNTLYDLTINGVG